MLVLLISLLSRILIHSSVVDESFLSGLLLILLACVPCTLVYDINLQKRGYVCCEKLTGKVPKSRDFKVDWSGRHLLELGDTKAVKW